MTLQELAELALRMLDAQQRYFNDRSHNNLIKSKNLESDLRYKAREILRAQTKLDLTP